ncbi:MAG: hypothetical protein IPK74_01355 [Deltaproteobacteria bacterium]|nr:hypothetical protein [Deltaproteobacteria bacterium]
MTSTRATAALRHPWAPVVAITVAFVVLAVIEVARGRFVHDEGLLTYHFAKLAWLEPRAALFLQKSRPPISLLYAPAAALGWHAFAVLHVLVAAAALPCIAAIAARLGHGRPAIATLVLAASPLFAAAAVAGVSNSDGVALACVATWLLVCTRRGALAGALLAALPWVRAELAPLSALLLVASGTRHGGRAWLGAIAFVVVYALLGALEHRDVLWLVHYPPALTEPMADNPYWAHHDGRVDAASIGATLLALTPAWMLAIPLRRGRIAREQWLWWSFAAFELGVLLALPRWRVFNFDLSPRYLLGVLPALALALSSNLQAWPEPPRVATRVVETLALAGALALGWAAAMAGQPLGGLVATAVAATALATARAGFVRVGIAIVTLLVIVGPLGFADGARLRRDHESPEIAELLARLREDPRLAGRPLYTNAPLLSATLAGRHGEVHYIVQADQLHELVALTNPDNGQRQRLLAAIARDFYGTPVFPDALAPELLPSDAVLLLVDDPRLSLVMPAAIWDDALVTLSASGRVRVAELRPRGAP